MPTIVEPIDGGRMRVVVKDPSCLTDGVVSQVGGGYVIDGYCGCLVKPPFPLLGVYRDAQCIRLICYVPESNIKLMVPFPSEQPAAEPTS